jgi:hypothetical protein
MSDSRDCFSVLVRTVCFPRTPVCHRAPRFTCVAGPASIQVPFQHHHMHLVFFALIRPPCSYAAMSDNKFGSLVRCAKLLRSGRICCYAQRNRTQTRSSKACSVLSRRHIVYRDRRTTSKRSSIPPKSIDPRREGPSVRPMCTLFIREAGLLVSTSARPDSRQHVRSPAKPHSYLHHGNFTVIHDPTHPDPDETPTYRLDVSTPSLPKDISRWA